MKISYEKRNYTSAWSELHLHKTKNANNGDKKNLDENLARGNYI